MIDQSIFQRQWCDCRNYWKSISLFNLQSTIMNKKRFLFVLFEYFSMNRFSSFQSLTKCSLLMSIFYDIGSILSNLSNRSQLLRQISLSNIIDRHFVCWSIQIGSTSNTIIYIEFQFENNFSKTTCALFFLFNQRILKYWSELYCKHQSCSNELSSAILVPIFYIKYW